MDKMTFEYILGFLNGAEFVHSGGKEHVKEAQEILALIGEIYGVKKSAKGDKKGCIKKKR